MADDIVLPVGTTSTTASIPVALVSEKVMPLTGWRAELIKRVDEIQARNRGRPCMVLIRWDGARAFQVFDVGQPQGRVEI